MIINIWDTIIAALVALMIGIFLGFKYEANQFNAFKQEVAVVGKVQQDESKQIEANHQRITKEISDAYQKDISVIRDYYAHKLSNNSSGGNLPTASPTARGADEASPHTVFAPFRTSEEKLKEDCAKTTEELNLLQDWAKEVSQ